MPSYQRLSPIDSIVSSPTAVAVDSNGNVYVTESTRNRLLIFSQSGVYKGSILSLRRPISVGVDDNGRIFIGNYYDNLTNKGNVEVYDAGLNFLFKLGTGDGEFSQPNSIAVDNLSGNIYVADKKSNVVKVYGANGGYAYSFDGTLNGGGQFNKPSSIVIDSGELVILDQPLILTQDDQGNEAWVNGARVGFFEMNGAYKHGFNKYGSNVGDMNKPAHLGADNEGRIYVSDTQYNVVLVYERSGEYLGAVYDLEDPLRTPVGIAINNGNVLYIASLNAGSVETYGITPFAQMAIDPLSLLWEEQRGESPSSQTVRISNNGDKSLGWTATASDSWITLSDTNGTVGPGSSFTLNIGVDIFGLQPGIYNGSVSISAEFGSAEVVNIELTLQDIPLIANPGGPYSVTEGQSVVVDGSGSSGAIVLYEWDMQDNGSYNYSSQEPLQSHIYAIAGNYRARLRITDDFGAKNNAAVTVSVLDAQPAVGFSVSPADGATPHTVNFVNGSTGYDQPLTYEWDFDNDGTTDSTVANPSYVYNYPGKYSVKLTVRDSDGSTVSLLSTDCLAVTDGGGCAASYVKNGAAEYSSIQGAYNAALAGDVIMGRNVNLSEAVNFNRDVTVTLSGGYNCGYLGRVGRTVINGMITVSRGTVIIGDFILE